MTNPSILHVEDEDASAFLLQAALEQASIPYRTFRVSTGEDALAFLFRTGVYREAAPPGLVILDLNLPRLDGWTVLSRMKGQRSLEKIPVVVLSSSDSEADKTRAMKLGAERYVRKESTVSAMRNVIAHACAGLIVFESVLEPARSYTLTTTSIAFERSTDNGVEINTACVLPEGAVIWLIGIDPASSSAHLRHDDQDVWMSLYDLRNYAVLNGPGHPDFPAVQYLSPA